MTPRYTSSKPNTWVLPRQSRPADWGGRGKILPMWADDAIKGHRALRKEAESMGIDEPSPVFGVVVMAAIFGLTGAIILGAVALGVL